METIMMKGKAVADAHKEKIAAKVAAAKAKGITITLAILTVGADPASHVYKNRLIKMAEGLGCRAITLELPETATQDQVLAALAKLNNDPNVTGIIPMMPMPKHIDAEAVGNALNPAKDMDCLSPVNCGAVFLGKGRYAACTPRACMATLEYYGISLEGKRVVVLGRSNVVGKPVALLLLQKNATVTICHSRTQNLAQVLQEADVIVAAIGKANFVKPDMVKPGVIIVDVGINVAEDGIVGDVDAAVAAKASAFTPVPGGIGTVSNVMLMDALTKDL